MEYMTMAQACGEQEFTALAFVPGVDFDHESEDECEIVQLASENDYQDRQSREINRLEQEIDRLRDLLGWEN